MFMFEEFKELRKIDGLSSLNLMGLYRRYSRRCKRDQKVIDTIVDAVVDGNRKFDLKRSGSKVAYCYNLTNYALMTMCKKHKKEKEAIEGWLLNSGIVPCYTRNEDGKTRVSDYFKKMDLEDEFDKNISGIIDPYDLADIINIVFPEQPCNNLEEYQVLNALRNVAIYRWCLRKSWDEVVELSNLGTHQNAYHYKKHAIKIIRDFLLSGDGKEYLDKMLKKKGLTFRSEVGIESLTNLDID